MSILRGFIFAISTRKCENRAGKALQFYIISLTEDTKRTSPVIKTSYQVILLVHILYMLLLLQVHINNFFCDLNFLYEYLISHA